MKKQAFTLVELIVVITILAILGTIAFISMQNYSTISRDSVRISNMHNIDTTLEVYQTKTGNYPEPNNYDTVTYAGIDIWKQGILGSEIKNNIGVYGDTQDKHFGNNELTYSTTNNGKDYEIGGLLEKEEHAYNSLNILLQANSAKKEARAFVKGSYNSRYLKTSTGGENHIIAVPSLILNTKGTDSNIQILVSTDKFVLKGTKTIPGSFTGGTYDSEIINFTPQLLYKGTSCSPTTDGDMLNFEMKLRKAYGEGVFKTLGSYSDLQNAIDTSTFEIKALSIANNNKCKNFEYIKSDIFPLSCGEEDGTFENIDDGFNLVESCLFKQSGEADFIVYNSYGNLGTKGIKTNALPNYGVTNLEYSVVLNKSAKFNFDLKIDVHGTNSYTKFYIKKDGGNYIEYIHYTEGDLAETNFITYTSPLLSPGDYDFKWETKKGNASVRSLLWLDNMIFTCIGGGSNCGWGNNLGFEDGSTNPWQIFDFSGEANSTRSRVSGGSDVSSGTYAIKSPHLPNYGIANLEYNVVLNEAAKFNFDIKIDVHGSNSYTNFYIKDISNGGDYIEYIKYTEGDAAESGFVTYTTPLLSEGSYKFKWKTKKGNASIRSYTWLDNMYFSCKGGGGTCGWTDFLPNNGLNDGSFNPDEIFTFGGHMDLPWVQDSVNKVEGNYSIMTTDQSTYKNSYIKTKSINLLSSQRINFKIKTSLGSGAKVYFYEDNNLIKTFTSSDLSNDGFIFFPGTLLIGNHTFKWELKTNYSNGKFWLDDITFTP